MTLPKIAMTNTTTRVGHLADRKVCIRTAHDEKRRKGAAKRGKLKAEKKASH